MWLVRKIRWLAYALFLSVTAVTVAQEATCPTIVREALAATDSACAGTGRNEACYGNIDLDAEAQPGVSDFNFSKPGDLVNVSGVQTLTLHPLDQESDTWGVALMKLQANLPETLPGQNVTFLLFGDVEIQNAVSSNVDEGDSGAVTLPVTVSMTSPIMESFTGEGASAMPKMLNAGTKATADGYLPMAQMIHVTLDDGSQGWLLEQMVKVDGDVSTLPEMDMNGEVVGAEEDVPAFTPMQAFYFKSGTNDAPCEEAPDSGILIQTPEGAGKIDLVVNDAKVTLGSTGYFQAQAGGEMTVAVVEGEGTVDAGGKRVTVPAGTYTTLPVDADLRASGQPADPQPYDPDSLKALPVSILPKFITIAPPIEVTPFVGGPSIIPTGGTWTATTGDFTTGGGCPPGMAEVMAQAGTVGSSNTFTMSENGFDLQGIMEAEGSMFPGQVTYSNPEPNLFLMEAEIEGGTFRYEFRIVSETQIDAFYTVTTEGCTISFTSTLQSGG
ncbi:MAG: hypothetical protein K8I30_05775 [Anaerolineae bacterium]|nr:hypothetical protein [Anaerolineae bacterium]